METHTEEETYNVEILLSQDKELKVRKGETFHFSGTIDGHQIRIKEWDIRPADESDMDAELEAIE